MCDFIGRSDPRFDVGGIADWMFTREALTDPAAAQRDRFLDLTRPIWDKCLGLMCGNHETAITKHYERDVYREIVAAVKQGSPYGVTPDFALGYESYLLLRFRRATEGDVSGRQSASLYLHHGDGGGKLKGAKALAQARRAAWHRADVVITGHVHDELATPVVWRELMDNGRIITRRCVTLVAGTFMGRAPYAVKVGLPPNACGTAHVVFRPWTVLVTGGKRAEGFRAPRSIFVTEI